MKAIPGRRVATGHRGFSLAELLVVALIFAIVALGAGTLYVSATRTMDDASALVYAQRQGTQIQEALQRHMERSTVLQVSSTQVLCRHASGLDVPAGKAVVYQRVVGASGTPTVPDTDERWCLYEYQPSGFAVAQLWRCRVAGLTPPQTCTSTPENLFAGALRGFKGLGLGTGGTAFTLAPCAVAGTCPTSVDIRFPLDVLRSASDPGSVLGTPLWFAFNVTVRN